MSKEILNVEEAAEFLSFNPVTIRLKARLGEILGRKIGKEWRFSRRALLAWIKGTEPRLADMTMLKPDEVEFLEKNCGLSFKRAKETSRDGLVSFWSFLVSNNQEPTERDLEAAHEMIAEYESSEADLEEEER